MRISGAAALISGCGGCRGLHCSLQACLTCASPARASPQVLDFPVRTLIRFWVNHHLLDLYQRPCWRVVSGRSKTYVDRITSGGLPQRAVHCGWWRKLA